VVYPAERIHQRVAELAREIERAQRDRRTGNESGHGRDPLVVGGLMKGAFVFLADLVRALRVPVQVDFLGAASYGDGKTSSGSVDIEHGPRIDLAGREVLLVEDIVDSGTTVAALLPALRAQGARHVEVCTLLHKRLRPLAHEPRFVGFDAPNVFLVGYGMDYAEDFRQLPYIASL